MWKELITEDKRISYHIVDGSGYEGGTHSQEQISIDELTMF